MADGSGHRVGVAESRHRGRYLAAVGQGEGQGLSPAWRNRTQRRPWCPSPCWDLRPGSTSTSWRSGARPPA
ncbi:hypothetical protein [Lysobacter gummosus]|uniref:hypothetical protein n=1 Tax=Lysobacter gummosus TaxID=262324 RepID=UPI003627841E